MRKSGTASKQNRWEAPVAKLQGSSLQRRDVFVWRSTPVDKSRRRKPASPNYATDASYLFFSLCTPQRLDDWPARDQAIYDYDDGDDEEQMNQAAAHIHYEEPENPQDEKNYRDGPKH
jgi:hypothetical protein